jgi:putative membrane protein
MADHEKTQCCAFGSASGGWGISALRADDTKADGDGKFLKEAADGGLLEVKLGELAVQQAQNPEVRRFGQRMVTDHTKANKQLMSLAEKSNIALSKTLSSKHQAVFNKFRDLKGADFDRAYMADMVKDHQDDVAEFTKCSKDAQSQQVREFAAQTLPTLEEHLRLARSVAAKVGAPERR